MGSAAESVPQGRWDLRKGGILGVGIGPQGWVPRGGRAGPELCSISQIAAAPRGAEESTEGAVSSPSTHLLPQRQDSSLARA